jgi:hypothetical protein
MNSDKLSIANKIIQKQSELIVLFDEWVQKIKANDLPEAAEIVKKSNKLRLEIAILKEQYAKLNKKSGIILSKSNIILGNKFN